MKRGSDRLQSVRRDFLQEEGRVVDTSEADRDATGARGRFLEPVWRISLSSPGHAQRTTVCIERNHRVPLKYIDVVRQTGINKDNSSIDNLPNIDGHRILSESWIGSTRFRILNKRSL